MKNLLTKKLPEVPQIVRLLRLSLWAGETSGFFILKGGNRSILHRCLQNLQIKEAQDSWFYC